MDNEKKKKRQIYTIIDSSSRSSIGIGRIRAANASYDRFTRLLAFH